ncbi:MAG TPA: hypothetical protein VJB90_01460 [Candidatus Nanoarchaeia archaeon]|nr:hypothetical protein [Candidatus Nanoarchaeia archaeon]
MGIIEFHEGCNARPPGCMGPWDNFYTVFGTELRFLIGHLVISLIIGAVIFGILFFLKKKVKLNLPIYALAVISLLISILLFFIFAYLIPIRVIY